MSSPSSAEPRRGWLAPPSRGAWVRTTWLWSVLGLAFVVAKLHKVHVMAKGAPLTADFAVVSHDLLWIVVAFAVWLWLFDRRTWGAFLTGLGYLLAGAIGTVVLSEHAYWTATGAVADGYILQEFIVRFRELWVVVRSEMTPARVFAMAAPMLYCLGQWVFFASRTPRPDEAPAQRASDWKKAVHWRRAVPLVVLAVLGVSTAFMKLPPAAEVLRRNVIAGVTTDLAEVVAGQTEEWASATVKPVEPLSLVRTGAPKAKNLLIITLESTSAKGTSLYGAGDYRPAKPTTPVLSSLAARGAKVEQAYTVLPHTSKALVSIECGAYPMFSSAVIESALGAIPSPCLARLLRQEGFATAFFQPAEENYEDRRDLVSEFGFETFIGKESIDGRGFDESSYFGWEDDAMVKPVTQWIGAQAKRGKPFFASLLTLTTHHPYAIPKGYAEYPYVEDHDLNQYLNTVAYTDRFVGKLIAELDRMGVMKDTVVFISGDHGEAFDDHGRYQHDTAVYEENVRVPLVMLGGGVVPGTTIPGVRQLTDIFPTALDALGYKPSRAVPGLDLLTTPGHDRIYMHCYFQKRCRALREGDFKYIDNYRQRTPEVFDLKNDPGEKENLFGNSQELDHRTRERIAEMTRIVGETNGQYAAQSKARVRGYVSKTLPAVGHRVSVDYGDVRIAAVSVSPSHIDTGGRVDVTVVYQVVKKPKGDLRTFMHVVGPRGWSNADHDPVGGAYPVSDWNAGEYVTDTYAVSTRPDHPVGEYSIVTGFWEKGAGRLKPLSTDLHIDGDERVRIGTFNVTKPKPKLEEFVLTARPVIEKPVDVTFGKVLRLIGTGIDKPALKGGLKTTVTSVYEVLEDLDASYGMTTKLRGPSPLSFEHVPVNGHYPLSQWKAGQFIVDRQELITKTRDRAGDYHVELTLTKDGKPVKPVAKDSTIPTTKSAVEIAKYEILYDPGNR